jgi:hypothetical protein
MEFVIVLVIVVAIFVVAMILGKSPPRRKRSKASGNRKSIDSTPPSTPSLFGTNAIKEPFVPEGPSEFDMRGIPNPNLWPLPPRTGYGYDLLY